MSKKSSILWSGRMDSGCLKRIGVYCNVDSVAGARMVLCCALEARCWSRFDSSAVVIVESTNARKFGSSCSCRTQWHTSFHFMRLTSCLHWSLSSFSGYSSIKCWHCSKRYSIWGSDPFWNTIISRWESYEKEQNLILSVLIQYPYRMPLSSCWKCTTWMLLLL